MWRQRHPEQWLRNRQRARLKADWAVYFWIPLINIVPITACYIVFWLARWPESWRPKLQQLHRLTALTVIFMIGMMIWYRWKGRKDS